MNSTDSSTVGAYPPPPGVVPNFTNPESIASRVVLAAALSPVFTIPIVLLRLYTSRFIIKCWHLDDCRSPSSKGTKGLLTQWQSLLQFRCFTRFMMLGAIPGAITYNLSTLFTKVSILHFYLRFSQDRAFKLATYFVMFVVVGNNLSAAFAFLYMCRPIPRYWDYTRPGSCLDVGSAFITCAVLNSVTDIVILCLPIWLLHPLRMRRLQKIGVTLVLMAGGLASNRADVWKRVRSESYQIGVYSIWTSQPRHHVAICRQFNQVVKSMPKPLAQHVPPIETEFHGSEKALLRDRAEEEESP
ncbi:hypothetical protein FOFC_18137 [Fusarium oxysporum]|nr:hypothetical protein FOFC_18137 [Fusarium oxysporum]